MNEFETPAPKTQISAETTRLLINLGALLSQDLPQVRRGNLWQATWADVTLAGAVLEVDDEDGLVWFAPLTVDLDYADPFTGLLDTEQNPLGVPIAVFAGLATPVPLMTLAASLGELPEAVTDTLHDLWRANRRGTVPKDPTLPTGSPDMDEADPRREYRNDLRYQASHLQAAQLTTVAVTDADATSAIDLAHRLVDAGIGPSDLVSDAVSLSYARQAAEGNAAVGSDLATRIAELLGEPNPTVFEHDGPPVPAVLAVCLNDPARFRIVREIMRGEDLTEVAAARRIPAMAKFRQIDQLDGQSDTEYWEHALDVLGT